MLYLILAAAGGGKTTHIMNLIEQFSAGGHKKLSLIVPEQFSFTSEKMMLGRVGAKAMADIDVTEIESYARNELQMELVNQKQITYISLNNRDVGEVVASDNGNIFASIWSFLTSWAE